VRETAFVEEGLQLADVAAHALCIGRAQLEPAFVQLEVTQTLALVLPLLSKRNLDFGGRLLHTRLFILKRVLVPSTRFDVVFIFKLITVGSKVVLHHFVYFVLTFA